MKLPTKYKNNKHCWTTQDVKLGTSDTIIPSGTEGIFLTGVSVNLTFLVWFYTLGQGYRGVVPTNSVRY